MRFSGGGPLIKRLAKLSLASPTFGIINFQLLPSRPSGNPISFGPVKITRILLGVRLKASFTINNRAASRADTLRTVYLTFERTVMSNYLFLATHALSEDHDVTRRPIMSRLNSINVAK